MNGYVTDTSANGARHDRYFGGYVMLLMPFPYPHAIAILPGGPTKCDRLRTSGARHDKYFGGYLDVIDAVPLPPCDRLLPRWPDAMRSPLERKCPVGARHQQIIGSCENVFL